MGDLDDLCRCRDCAGYPCLCANNDHCDWKGAHCRCCGETNYSYLGYLGARARWAKARGLTVDEWDERGETMEQTERVS